MFNLTLRGRDIVNASHSFVAESAAKYAISHLKMSGSERDNGYFSWGWKELMKEGNASREKVLQFYAKTAENVSLQARQI